MSDKKYRVAVVGGAGQWGRFYMGEYAARPECEIIALVDRAKDRREAFAERYGAKAIYDSLDDLLAREVPDIVSLIVPVGQNHELVTACAEAGVKVVSCEKPIAVELADADAMVRVCEERGTRLACGTAYWDFPCLEETAKWISRGNIGRLTGASIPGGLPKEVAGSGCVALTIIRLLTGMEAEWVEGWTLPPWDGFEVPSGRPESEIDCPAYGRVGLSGGIVCEIPKPPPPGESVGSLGAVTGDDGQVWTSIPKPIIIKGCGAESYPVFPSLLLAPNTRTFDSAIDRLLRAFDTGSGVACNGHDYRQALEIAIALKLSAENGHERIPLPLEDRSLRIYPHPYRLLGGDVAGWETIGYKGAPAVEPYNA